MALKRLVFKVEGMHCEGCAVSIETFLKGIKGVKKAKVDYHTSTAVVEYEDEEVKLIEIMNAPIFKEPSPYKAKPLLS